MNRKKKKEKERRVCLRCGRSFLSAGPWNRLCKNCHEYIRANNPYDVNVNIEQIRRA